MLFNIYKILCERITSTSPGTSNNHVFEDSMFLEKIKNNEQEDVDVKDIYNNGNDIFNIVKNMLYYDFTTIIKTINEKMGELDTLIKSAEDKLKKSSNLTSSPDRHNFIIKVITKFKENCKILILRLQNVKTMISGLRKEFKKNEVVRKYLNPAPLDDFEVSASSSSSPPSPVSTTGLQQESLYTYETLYKKFTEIIKIFSGLYAKSARTNAYTEDNHYHEKNLFCCINFSIEALKKISEENVDTLKEQLVPIIKEYRVSIEKNNATYSLEMVKLKIKFDSDKDIRDQEYKRKNDDSEDEIDSLEESVNYRLKLTENIQLDLEYPQKIEIAFQNGLKCLV
jgi:hypothetical protein